MSEIDDFLKLSQKIRGDAAADNKWGWDLSFPDFMKAMACLNPQSSGGRIENRLSNLLGLTRTNNPDRGDRRSKNLEYIEFKGSIITSSNKNLNLVQIRPWQDVNYIFYIYDIRDMSAPILRLLSLNKEQMSSEVIKCGVTSAHGTKTANSDNHNIELALRLEADSIDYIRWITNYNVTLEALQNKYNHQ